MLFSLHLVLESKDLNITGLVFKVFVQGMQRCNQTITRFYYCYYPISCAIIGTTSWAGSVLLSRCTTMHATHIYDVSKRSLLDLHGNHKPLPFISAWPAGRVVMVADIKTMVYNSDFAVVQNGGAQWRHTQNGRWTRLHTQSFRLGASPARLCE
jgi:hypothetical protein